MWAGLGGAAAAGGAAGAAGATLYPMTVLKVQEAFYCSSGQDGHTDDTSAS